jgi:hypothetical protein
MVRKMIYTALLGVGLAMSSYAAEVIVRVAPPRAVVEHRIARPGPNYIWTPGYQRWDGRAYVWAPGVWVVPPRHHAHWVHPYWAHRGGGWVFVDGRWR